eukprot:5706090-Pyramimonas_sp.AAC.1
MRTSVKNQRIINDFDPWEPSGRSSWRPLGQSKAILESSWAVLEASWTNLKASWSLLGRLGGQLGPSWRPSWANLAVLEAILKRLGFFWWTLGWFAVVSGPFGWPAGRAEAPVG